MNYDNPNTGPEIDERAQMIDDLISDMSDTKALTRFGQLAAMRKGLRKKADFLFEEAALAVTVAKKLNLIPSDWDLANDVTDIWYVYGTDSDAFTKAVGDAARIELFNAMYYEQR